MAVSATSLQENELLALLGNLAHNLGVGLACLLIGKHLLGNRSERYGDDDILGILARRTRTRATLAILGKLVTLVLEVDKSPILALALQNDAATLATVATIGTSEGDKFLTAEVSRARTTVSGARKNLNVIHKVRTCHILYFCRFSGQKYKIIDN